MSSNCTRTGIPWSACTCSLPSIIVAGLGRCGTSLVMQMLQAGGVRCIGDWPAFEPETAAASKITGEWIGQQHGAAFKVLDPQRARCTFADQRLIVIFLTRDVREQAASLAKFGAATFGLYFNRGQRRVVAAGLTRDTPTARARFDGLPLIELTFENIIRDPIDAAASIALFLLDHGHGLDAVAAANQVRSRPPGNYPGLLEAVLMQESQL